MSEEEIIERINDLIHTCDIGIKKHGEYDNLFELDKQALTGLLDLYNKEKEKNEEFTEILEIVSNQLNIAYDQIPIEIGNLINRNKELEIKGKCYNTAYNSGKSFENQMWESKIQEKIKELENQKDLYFEKQIIQGRIDLLKELLK